MVVNDITTDQFTDHAANQNIGREVIQSADTRKAHRCCESIRACNNQRLVVILESNTLLSIPSPTLSRAV